MTDRHAELLGGALHLAELGLPVFPCHSPSRSECSCGKLGCGSAGKHPRIKGWQRAATCNADQIRTWWARWSDANIGVATRGLLVIDIDAGGDQSLRQLEQLYGSLPPTMTVSTGGPGTHLYYRRPPERKIACNVRRLGPRIDVRGDGGFVIAPPSRHRSGDLYTLQVATRWQHPRGSSIS